MTKILKMKSCYMKRPSTMNFLLFLKTHKKANKYKYKTSNKLLAYNLDGKENTRMLIGSLCTTDTEPFSLSSPLFSAAAH